MGKKRPPVRGQSQRPEQYPQEPPGNEPRAGNGAPTNVTFTGTVLKIKAFKDEDGFTCVVELESESGDALSVYVDDHRFQSILEMAMVAGNDVTVTYDDTTDNNVLTAVEVDTSSETSR